MRRVPLAYELGEGGASVWLSLSKTAGTSSAGGSKIAAPLSAATEQTNRMKLRQGSESVEFPFFECLA